VDTAENGGHYSLILRRAAQDALAAFQAGQRGRLAAAMVELGRVMPEAPKDFDPRPYIAANEWRYAKTRPQNPHFYVLLVVSSDPYEHLRFLAWLQASEEVEDWGGKRFHYHEVDGWRYWALTNPNATIINRRVAPEAQLELGVG
jgi:hypothetical protein